MPGEPDGVRVHGWHCLALGWGERTTEKLVTAHRPDSRTMCQVSNAYAWFRGGSPIVWPVRRSFAVALLPSSHVAIVARRPVMAVTRVRKSRSVPAGTT